MRKVEKVEKINKKQNKKTKKKTQQNKQTLLTPRKLAQATSTRPLAIKEGSNVSVFSIAAMVPPSLCVVVDWCGSFRAQ